MWLPRLLLVSGYLGFAFALSFVLGTKDSDLDVFFWPAAQLAAHGHPLLIYTVHTGPFPNANGPLSLVPLTAVAIVADWVGWSSNAPLRDGLVLVVFSGFTLLAAREAAHLVEMAGIRGRSPAIYAAVCLSIPLWLALGSFGHIEIPLEIWLTLMALRLALRGRGIPTGVLLGLVLLTRSSAVVLIVGVTVFVASEPRRESLLSRFGRSASVLGVALATTLLGLAPFLVFDAHATISSLLSFRGSLPIGGGSIWVVLARGLPWSGVVQHFDAVLMVIAAALLGGLIVVRVPETAPDVRRAAVVMTVAACCVPLLAKTTWAYYLAEPYAFAVVAVAARRGSLRPSTWAVPILLAFVSLILAVVGLSIPPTTLEMFVGPAAGVAIAGAIFALILE
jgi:hypothetical protein